FGHGCVFGGARSWGRTLQRFDLPGGLRAAPLVAEATVLRSRLPAVARCAQRLPAGAVPEHRFVAIVRDDVVDDVGRSDQIMALAFHAQRMIVQEGCAFCSPAL